MVADIITGSLIRKYSRSHKSYLTYVIPLLQDAGEQVRNAGANLANFIRRRLYQDFGMKELIERFYKSIKGELSVPIPYREIILTARIMDQIFAQIYPDKNLLNRTNGMKLAPEVLPVASGEAKRAEAQQRTRVARD